MNPLRHRSVRCHLIGLALLALLLGQWAVLAHAVSHAQPSAVVAAVAAHADEADHLWGHQAGTTACHLVDHLLAGQAPGGATAALAVVPPSSTVVTVPSSSIDPGPVWRTYFARGPPGA